MNKKQIVVENISHFDKNMLNEGGIFHINKIDGNLMYATYEYLDDVNYQPKRGRKQTTELNPQYIYVSFDCLEPHPMDNRWVKVEQEWQKPTHKESDLETLDNNSPRPPREDYYSELTKGYEGSYYMPKLQKIDKGDNIKLIKASFTMKTGEVIPCYNLSLLGDSKSGAGMSVQTMMAHFWKGKLLNYKKNTDVKIQAKGTPRNVHIYLMNMVNLVRNTPEIANFNADYIAFPESSSTFNDYIAKYLKRYIFPNAVILRNGTIPKLDTWEMDFGSMIMMTVKDMTEKGGQGYSTHNKYAHNKEWSDYLVYNTILSRAKEIFKNFILSNVKTECERKEYSGSRKERYELWDKIESYYKTEYERFNKALIEKGFPELNYDKFFLTVLWDTLRGGFFEWAKGYGHNVKKIPVFNSVKAVRNAFRGQIVYIDTDKLYDNGKQKKTSVKEFDSIQRLSIDKQFGFKPNNEDGTSQVTHEHQTARVVIVDDNYATGASLRNAAQVLMDNGFLAKNIITLTPGDMGGASNAGKQGADVPHQNAEADLIHKIVNGRIGGTADIDDETMQGFRDKHEELHSGNTKKSKKKKSSNTSNAHKERNMMHDMWFDQEQPQQYRQAESRKLNMNDIQYIIAETIKRLK